jgi:hypothetical protein
MKRLLVLVAAVAAVAGLASVALAGDYHVGTSLICSDCHIMHGSMAHPYPTGATAPFTAGGHAYLLRQDGVNNMCLGCHDGSGTAPDVFGATASGPTNGRLAGGLNADPAERPNDTGYAMTDGHTLYSHDIAPGGTFANTEEGLECADCHSVHGSANYRNMRISTSTTSTSVWVGKTVTYSIGGATPDLSKDVWERNFKGYGWSNVDYLEPTSTASAYGNWCKACHTDFHGSSTDGNMVIAPGDFKRHPTADANFSSRTVTQYNSRTNKLKVMDPTGTWTTANTSMTPSCFSCHKSHGNMNGFGLIFMTGTGTIAEEGDDAGGYRDMCRGCHSTGSLPAGNPPLP